MRPFAFLITALVVLSMTTAAPADEYPWWDAWRGPTAAWMSRAIILNADPVDVPEPDDDTGQPGFAVMIPIERPLPAPPRADPEPAAKQKPKTTPKPSSRGRFLRRS